MRAPAGPSAELGELVAGRDRPRRRRRPGSTSCARSQVLLPWPAQASSTRSPGRAPARRATTCAPSSWTIHAVARAGQPAHVARAAHQDRARRDGARGRASAPGAACGERRDPGVAILARAPGRGRWAEAPAPRRGTPPRRIDRATAGGRRAATPAPRRRRHRRGQGAPWRRSRRRAGAGRRWRSRPPARPPRRARPATASETAAKTGTRSRKASEYAAIRRCARAAGSGA